MLFSPVKEPLWKTIGKCSNSDLILICKGSFHHFSGVCMCVCKTTFIFVHVCKFWQYSFYYRSCHVYCPADIVTERRGLPCVWNRKNILCNQHTSKYWIDFFCWSEVTRFHTDFIFDLLTGHCLGDSVFWHLLTWNSTKIVGFLSLAVNWTSDSSSF